LLSISKQGRSSFLKKEAKNFLSVLASAFPDRFGLDPTPVIVLAEKQAHLAGPWSSFLQVDITA
jgi:hypothetical protein